MRNGSPYIIAVDDEKEFLMLFKASLVSKGYDVDTSLNGNHLWEKLSLKLPDIIFLDIQMKGIHGGELCRQLKQNKTTGDIPIILLSGNDNTQQLAEDCGADGFINKPSNTKAIVAEIDRIFAQHVST